MLKAVQVQIKEETIVRLPSEANKLRSNPRARSVIALGIER